MWTSMMEVEIAATKDNAKDAEKNDDSIYRVYTDGSGIDEQIGASAVLYVHSIEWSALRLHLGSNEQHTVFEGEGVGGCLALVLLLDLPEVQGPVTIAVDSQPAILAVHVRVPNPSHWMWDTWHELVQVFQQRHLEAPITIRWMPGHVGIMGNEHADEEAQCAAQAQDSSDWQDIPPGLYGDLPWSHSAVQQLLNTTQKADYEKQWRASTRYARTAQYDNRLLKGSYLDLADTLLQSYTVLLLQLHTSHVPLAKHLHRIHRADSPICPCCQADESVAHYLLHCPKHLHACQALYSAAGPDAHVLCKLLGNPKLWPHLFRYLSRTGHFHSVHGSLTAMPNPQPNCLTRCEFVDLLNNLCMPTTHSHSADLFRNPVGPPGFLEDWAALQANLCANPPPDSSPPPCR
jgi:ribonuclease HI